MNLRQLTRGDRIAGISAILLIVTVVALPWHLKDQGTSPLGKDLGERWVVGIEAPNGLWGWLAILCAVFMLVMIVLDRLIGAEELPLPLAYYQLTFLLALASAGFLLLKLWRGRAGPDLGWGAAIAVILAAAMVYGAALVLRGGQGDREGDFF